MKGAGDLALCKQLGARHTAAAHSCLPVFWYAELCPCRRGPPRFLLSLQVYPRPKEFIMRHRVSEVLRTVLDSEARGEDAVRLEAQKLLNAFHINVLL